jgi:hypothetical protein
LKEWQFNRKKTLERGAAQEQRALERGIIQKHRALPIRASFTLHVLGHLAAVPVVETNHLTMKVLFCFSGQQPGEKKPEASQTGIAKLEELP